MAEANAKRIGRTETIELLNGDSVELRPLNIKLLRKFMKKFKEMNEFSSTTPADEAAVESYDDDLMDLVVDMAAIALSKKYPSETSYLHNSEASRDDFEELVDQDIVLYINEVCGGITMTVDEDDRIDVEDLMRRNAD